MKAKDLNNSSLKTKKAIKQAFAELLQEKQKLNKITINDIAEKANINRGTFYLHYDSIFGVAEDFEEEILNNFMLNDNKDLKNIDDVNLYFDKIITYLKENEETYRKLLSSYDSLMFLEKLNSLINEKIHYTLINVFQIKKTKSLEFDVAFFADAITNAAVRYFQTNSEYTLDEIGSYIKKNFVLLFLSNTM